MAKTIEPSSWRLGKMIEAAEHKFAASREQALQVRFARARGVNVQVAKEAGDHDCRRYVYAGDKR